MPEPIFLKIVTDADDSGVRKYDNSLQGLHTSSRKASAALNAFSRDIIEAKSGADLASASAESLAHIFHQGLAGAVVIGGVKLLSDQIKAMGETIRFSGEETKTAVKELEKMGEVTGIADATRSAAMLDQHLDAVTKKLEAIKGGNWFTKMLADVTGTTKELEAQEATLQRLKDSQIALGILEEKMRAQKMQGASDEMKQIESVNDKYNERLKLANQIKDEDLKKQAISDINAIKGAEMADVQLKLQKQYLDQLNKEADARDQLNQATEAQQVAQGKVAQMASKIGGTARGAGQKPTSFEVGMARQVQKATAEEARQQAERTMMDVAKRIGATRTGPTGKTEISDLNKVKNQMIEDAKKGARIEEAKKWSMKESDKAVKKATDAQEQANKQTEETGKALDKLNKEANKLHDSTKENTNSQKSLKDSTDKATEAQKDLKKSSDKNTKTQEGGGAATGGETTTGILNSIKELLKQNFDELKAYAHAT